MTPIDDADVIEAMHLYGGSFVRTLAELYDRGDEDNRARIKATWPEYFEEYADLARRQARREAREKHEDDGQEYGHPGDRLRGVD